MLATRGRPAPAGQSAGFRFSEIDSASLGLWEGERPVLVYNHGIKQRPGVPVGREHSCYVHPLYGMDGEVLTDDYPADHVHHRGLFWAWPHVRVGNVEHDLWTLTGIRPRFERWIERSAGADAATLAVENGWYVGERRVLSESVRFAVRPAAESERAIDIELRWTSGDDRVTLLGAAGKSYGGLSLRFAPREDTAITTPEGRQPKDLNLTRLTWADLSARFAPTGNPSGISIFVDRDHPGFPPTWITRHYGFLGIGWPGVDAIVLEPGKPVTCRYRLWIHRGPVEPARVSRAYQAYAGSTLGR